ncbi:LysM domain-containing protein [Aeromicrobium sp. NPDC092404]|uniref:LysM peptidoglycan-binding domain-containing protein n=1 Tax=Aeromicrobium sp. NPDC092404 TaxID=3154976 RepID=UPI0034408E8C
MVLSRAGWFLTGLAGMGVALLAPGADQAVRDVAGPSLPTALLGLGCLVQLALSTWVLLTVALTLMRAPDSLVRAIAPRLLRSALLAGTAGALVLGPVHAERSTVPDARARHDPAGLRLPDRPVASPPRASAAPSTVVVRPGDTLWAIAARSLPADASDAEVAAAWRRWHAVNRDVIGADPHLIFPKQRLHPPLGKAPT